MKLINGLPPKLNVEPAGEEQPLANVQKRLQLLYPGRHELKINADQELLLVHLNLTLEEATGEDQITVAEKTVLSHAGV